MSDFREACRKYVLPGYLPSSKLFDKSTRIVTAGSCFAQNLSDAARSLGMASTHLHFSEAGASAPGFAQLLQETLAGQHGAAGDVVRSADLVVLTLGIGFGLFVDNKFSLLDRLSREEIKRSGWRYLNPGEIANGILSAITTLRAVRPDVSVVLTLSPLPLNSALTHQSPFGADCVSKSLQRVALEAVIGDQIPGVHYWPSFEMVRWLGPHRGQTFGVDANNRHISPAMTAEIMSMFFDAYFQLEST